MAGIPEIKPYPMPDIGELPSNTADWVVDPSRAVLLLHDMQKYFLRPFPQNEAPVVDLVERSALLRERCAGLGIPVAYTMQPGDMSEGERGLLKDFWGPGMNADPINRNVVDPLAPCSQDWVFTKWRYSAFHRTDFLDRMRQSGRDQLIICGVYAHVGILMTACDAFTNDIQPFLAADAIADFTIEYHTMTVDYAASRCAVVATTKELLVSLDNTEVGGER